MPSKMIECPYGPTNTYNLSSPLGGLVLTSCPQGIHSLGIEDKVTDSNFEPEPGKPVEIVSQLYQDNGYTYKPATQCLYWLQWYFHSHDSKDVAMPNLCAHIGKEGSFTHTVWFTLLQRVPFGKTISYRSLAQLCGNANACRAVGQAMRNNPVGLVIPCHRVIQENGQFGNYSRGTRNKVKEWLLKHESMLQ